MCHRPEVTALSEEGEEDETAAAEEVVSSRAFGRLLQGEGRKAEIT